MTVTATVVESPSDWTDCTDGELVVSAREGKAGAFAELYRRHAGSAWRVAMAVASNEADAADVMSEAFTRVLARGGPDDPAKFRPYLLRVVRNTALTVRHRRGRDKALEDIPEVASASAGPAGEVVAGVNAAMVRTAFASLPERWRLTLWLTEVEQMPPREAAGILAISANAVSQLAVRARVGLRDRYLQAHLATTDVPPACRVTVDRLGAYTVGTLGARDRMSVTSHLKDCTPCRARLAELDEVRRYLPALLPVLPAGLADRALHRWSGVDPTPYHDIGPSAIGVYQHLAQLATTRAAQVPLAAAAAASASPATVGAASVAVAAVLLAVAAPASWLGGGGATGPAPAVPAATATSPHAANGAVPAQAPSSRPTKPSSSSQSPGGPAPAAAATQGPASAAPGTGTAQASLAGFLAFMGAHSTAPAGQKVSTQNVARQGSPGAAPATGTSSNPPGLSKQLPQRPSQQVPKATPPNVGPPNVRPPNVRPPNVRPPNVGPPNVGPPNVRPPNVGPPNVGPLIQGTGAMLPAAKSS